MREETGWRHFIRKLKKDNKNQEVFLHKTVNVEVSPGMKRGTCSATVRRKKGRNKHELGAECFSGSGLYSSLPHVSPAPNSTSSPKTLISSYNYPHLENEGDDVWAGQAS